MKFIRKRKQAHTKSSFFTQRLNNISRWNYLSLTQKYRIPPNKFAVFLCLLINKIRFPYEWSPALDDSEHSK